MTKYQFLWKEIHYCHKKLILVTRNQFLSQEIISCHKKSFLVTRNHFLWVHILRLNLSIRDNSWIQPNNSLELIHFVGTWFPGSQRNSRPASSLDWIRSVRISLWILPKNSLELIHFVGTWFPGSQWIRRPELVIK